MLIGALRDVRATASRGPMSQAVCGGAGHRWAKGVLGVLRTSEGHLAFSRGHSWSGVAHFFCSFSFLPSLAMLCYPPGRACPNFEPFDSSDCKEVAVSLTFANVDGYADHVSRNRQTEFLGAGPKHLQFSDKLLLRYHRCTWGGR